MGSSLHFPSLMWCWGEWFDFFTELVNMHRAVLLSRQQWWSNLPQWQVLGQQPLPQLRTSVQAPACCYSKQPHAAEEWTNLNRMSFALSAGDSRSSVCICIAVQVLENSAVEDIILKSPEKSLEFSVFFLGSWFELKKKIFFFLQTLSNIAKQTRRCN